MSTCVSIAPAGAMTSSIFVQSTGVTYSGHIKGGPWVKNEAGIGLLTFWNVPLKK